MSSSEKLRRAYEIIQKLLQNSIYSIDMILRLATIKITLRDGVKIFIRYNNYFEYSYSIILSSIEHDRVRFDNFDDRWNVATRPHHFHPRYDKKGYASSMNGDPENDLPLLISLLKSQKLIETTFRI